MKEYQLVPVRETSSSSSSNLVVHESTRDGFSSYFANKYSQHMGEILSTLHQVSSQPNEYEDCCPTPETPLQIFEFIVRTFFSIRFSEISFSSNRSEPPVNLFLGARESGDIFTEDDDDDEKLLEGGITMFYPVDWEDFETYFVMGE